MPLLATTPLLSPLLDSELETRLPLPTVSDRLAVLDTPTPPLLAASVRALPATPSAVVVPLTTLASAVPVSDVDSPSAAPTSDALVPVPPVATTTVMHTLVPEVPLP